MRRAMPASTSDASMISGRKKTAPGSDQKLKRAGHPVATKLQKIVAAIESANSSANCVHEAMTSWRIEAAPRAGRRAGCASALGAPRVRGIPRATGRSRPRRSIASRPAPWRAPASVRGCPRPAAARATPSRLRTREVRQRRDPARMLVEAGDHVELLAACRWTARGPRCRSPPASRGNRSRSRGRNVDARDALLAEGFQHVGRIGREPLRAAEARLERERPLGGGEPELAREQARRSPGRSSDTGRPSRASGAGRRGTTARACRAGRASSSSR